MKYAAIALSLFAAKAIASPTVADVHKSLEDVHYSVDHNNVSATDIQATYDTLQNILDLLNKRPSKLMCSKIGNGQYYPVRRAVGDVLGDSDYQAGFSKLDDCKKTLPLATDTLA